MDWIEQRLTGFEDRIACHEPGRSWTYRAFCEEIDRLREIIGSIVDSKPSVIAICQDSLLQSLAALLAIAQLKQVALPIAIEASVTKQQEQQRVAGAAFIVDRDGLRALEASVNPPERMNRLSDLEHAGLILFSSGTSGEPKAMLHDLAALLKRYDRVQPRTDRTMQLLPADHIGGLDSALRTLFAGSTLVVPEARTALSVGAAIERYRVNVLPASPTFLNLMLLAGVAEKFDCSSLEVIAYGAEPMPKPLLERLIAAFPKVEFQQKFGTSETGAVRIKSQSDGSLYFRIEDADVEWRVVDGELWLKTNSRILGYLNADETSLEADGWYRTGDLVEEIERGYLRIIGRRSDWINVGGQKVHPAEIEQVIAEIEGVDACVVFSRPNALTGSAVACKIVTSLGDDRRSWKRRIRAYCRGRLENWKIPVAIELSGHLSMTDRLKRDA